MCHEICILSIIPILGGITYIFILAVRIIGSTKAQQIQTYDQADYFKLPCTADEKIGAAVCVLRAKNPVAG